MISHLNMCSAIFWFPSSVYNFVSADIEGKWPGASANAAKYADFASPRTREATAVSVSFWEREASRRPWKGQN